jgi:hypothetical protein
MKYFEKLTKSFVFERIKKTLFVLFLTKILGIPLIFLFFYSLYINRKLIVDAASTIPSDPENHLEVAISCILWVGIFWLALAGRIDSHLESTNMDSELIAKEMCEDLVIVQDTTIEEAIEMIKSVQFERAESYEYPWNKIYGFEIEHSRKLNDWKRDIYTLIEELQENENE